MAGQAAVDVKLMYGAPPAPGPSLRERAEAMRLGTLDDALLRLAKLRLTPASGLTPAARAELDAIIGALHKIRAGGES